VRASRQGDVISRPARAVILGALLAALPCGVAAQRDACDPSELEVRSLSFRGNRAFTDGQLAAIIELTASPALRRVVGGTRGCGNPALVAIDRARLIIYYRRRGYPDVHVDTTVARSGRVMDLRFGITEGALTRI
jgi:outer membrane protein assembly factor BamA